METMKITVIKTLVVNAQLRKWVFVKVEIDVPVLVRWGEASLEWKTRSVVGAVEDQGG
jgi:galactonate dehydratase